MEAAPTAPTIEELREALSDRQKAFVDAYLGEARKNASLAARLSSPSGESLAPGSDKTLGSRMLTNVDIRAYIDAVLDAAGMSAKEIINELSNIARLDLTRYIKITRGAASIDLAKMEKEGALGLISGLEYSRTGKLIVKFHSKQEALKILAQIRGLNKLQVEMSGDVGVAIREYPEGV